MHYSSRLLLASHYAIHAEEITFAEDLVLAEERTTEKDKKRIMEGRDDVLSSNSCGGYFNFLSIFSPEESCGWQAPDQDGGGGAGR